MAATATLLQNGRVLVAGGTDGGDPSAAILSSAELYDPATGRFTPTGSMAFSRSDHTSTLLQDGHVLVAGGYGCPNSHPCRPSALASAETYDPKTGKFTETGSMLAGRSSATATLLNDGQVLLASGARYPERAELYDPNSGRFRRTGEVLGFNNDATATLLNSGSVLVTGRTDNGPAAELYDRALGKFTQVPFQPAPGASASAGGPRVVGAAPDAATLLKDGRVLLFEGGSLQTYDPATGAFTASGSLSPPGEWLFAKATILADGRVLLEGGTRLVNPSDETYDFSALAGLYDPASGPRLINPMPTPRLDQTATLLPDGSVLIAGGTSGGSNALSSAELFK
jgi:hypothetical protein